MIRSHYFDLAANKLTLMFSPLIATRLIGTLVEGRGRLVGAPDLYLKEVCLFVAALATHGCTPRANRCVSAVYLNTTAALSISCASDALGNTHYPVMKVRIQVSKREHLARNNNWDSAIPAVSRPNG